MPNSSSYPILIPLSDHHTTTTITDCHRSTKLFPRLTSSDFDLAQELSREVWLLRTLFDIAPVNKLICLTLLLSGTEKFSKIFITLSNLHAKTRPFCRGNLICLGYSSMHEPGNRDGID